MARTLSWYGRTLSSSWIGFWQALLFGMVYACAAQCGHWLSFEPGHAATFWPASGLYLMTLTLASRTQRWRLISAAIIANISSDWLNDKAFFFSLTMTAANTLEATVGSWLLCRGVEGRFSLERSLDVKRLLFIAVFAPLLSAAVPSTSAMLLFGSRFEDVYLVWWLADCVGILVMAPIVWAWLTKTWPDRIHPWRLVELAASLTLTTLSTLTVFTEQLDEFSFPFLLMPLLFWPAIRFGAVAVSSHVVMLAIVITIATRSDMGTIAALLSDPAQRALIVQAFLATVSAPFLLLAVMWHERALAAEELERRIAVRTQELAEADRRKDHFLAVLAHELRNPMAPLSYALDIWPTALNDPGRLEELRHVMACQVNHMSGLIDDLLDVSRIAGGKILLRKERLDLREVVQTAVQAARSQAEQAGQALEVELDSQPIWVEGDRARLNQILGNLLNNAIKYTGSGGWVKVSAQRSDRWGQVQVRDNGPGIPAADLNRIFELFTQVDQTLERAHGGLGIGLTLVQNLVHLHGGQVVAESEGLGRGSCFTVQLPTEPSAPISSHPSNNDRNAHNNVKVHARKMPARRILVVDDTQASGRMLSVLLKSLGQEVEVCCDGPTALSMAATWKPVLIFLDIAMPGMSGYEVATHLKANPATKEIILVAMTGFGQESDRQRAFAAGFDRHLTKPAKLESLADVIHQIPENETASSV